jgi:hypothetical protein
MLNERTAQTLLNKRMMNIADHPTDPWFEKEAAKQGWSVFKYCGTITTAQSVLTIEEEPVFDARDGFLKHLTSKIK